MLLYKVRLWEFCALQSPCLSNFSPFQIHALAEDYWHRQIPPANYQSMAHPHMRDFKKLQESPSFGLSSRDRKCLGFEDSEKEEDEFKGFKLRSYQLEGVNWLLFNWWNKRSCILADEMGLGKTIQSTAFLRELQSNENTQIRGPFLIVAPLSLAGQWQSELASWAPDMNVLLYHGSEKARDFLVKEEFYFKEPFASKGAVKGMKKESVTKFHVLITTYEVVLKDAAVLSKIRWKVLIVDEAHRLKNHTSRLFSELGAVKRDHCVLLTGTPIANATEELWALLHFSNPTIFEDRDDFLRKFGEMTDAEQVNGKSTVLQLEEPNLYHLIIVSLFLKRIAYPAQAVFVEKSQRRRREISTSEGRDSA